METPFEVGKAYLIRTVTMIQTGRVVKIVGNFLVLDDAAWIADTGRFHDAIKSAHLDEVEPMGNGVFVSIGAIVDVVPWVHDLPTVQQ